MKNSIIILFTALSVAFATAQTQPAPAQKIGYADPNLIFSQLPEFKQIENELKTHNTQLENQMKAKVEGMRALVVKLAFNEDMAHALRAEGRGHALASLVVGEEPARQRRVR